VQVENSTSFKSVVQYNSDGSKKANFPSIAQASRETKMEESSISGACHGRNLSVKGYIFLFSGDEHKLPGIMEKIKDYKSKRTGIIQYDLNHKELNRFQSTTEAAKAAKLCITTVQSYLKGKGAGGGYIWKRVPME